jgi:hypothetical protein
VQQGDLVYVAFFEQCNREIWYTVAALNIEPLGTIFVGEESKEVSMVFGSFPQKKESQVVQ